MDASDLAYTSALDLAASIRQKQLSPVEVVEGALAQIERLCGIDATTCITVVNALLDLKFLSVYNDGTYARRKARA